jgi:hypothetical protein
MSRQKSSAKTKLFLEGVDSSMQTVKTAAMMPEQRAESLKLLKRIGTTTFEVSVHFSETSKETLEDKILRLIEREVTRSA